LGYWVSESRAGRGLAAAAVADVTELAFGELGLHRLDAATLLHNTPSQRVLLRNGFRPFAVAESYIKIAGRWQDHILFQLFSPGGTTPQSRRLFSPGNDSAPAFPSGRREERGRRRTSGPGWWPGLVSSLAC
jgi:hypothetical protein